VAVLPAGRKMTFPVPLVSLGAQLIVAVALPTVIVSDPGVLRV